MNRLTATVLASILILSSPCTAGSDMPEATRGQKPVRSLQELRQESVVRQQWDFSCGAAALSTVLTYQLGDPVSEGQVIAGILQRADPVKIRARQGFSLLDLKRFAVSRGHSAEGYGQLDLSQLQRIAPAIVPTRLDDYDHFVVVRGIIGEQVILADPAFGNRTLSVDRFERIWPLRIAFVVASEVPPGSRTSLEDFELAQVSPAATRELIGIKAMGALR